jgi:hypothetical protein
MEMVLQSSSNISIGLQIRLARRKRQYERLFQHDVGCADVWRMYIDACRRIHCNKKFKTAVQGVAISHPLEC